MHTTVYHITRKWKYVLFHEYHSQTVLISSEFTYKSSLIYVISNDCIRKPTLTFTTLKTANSNFPNFQLLTAVNSNFSNFNCC
jgi:hypothetical protein